MIKKYIFLFLIFLIISTGVASAQIIVITTAPTPTIIPIPTTSMVTTIPPVLEKLSQTYYGEVRYADGNLVSTGSIITAKDQYGKILGNYTIREIGQYGSLKPYREKMVVSVLRNQSDRSSRSSVIFVNFFVDGVRARDTSEFRVGEDKEFDILLPIIKPTPVPTMIQTTIPIITIATSKPVETMNISVPTIIPTLPISSTSTIITGIEDMQLVIYGLIIAGLTIFGMIIIVIIQSYLMRKSSRETSLGPDGKWDRK